MASAKNVWLKDCLVKSAKSANGSCRGYHVHWSSSGIYLQDCLAQDLSASEGKDLDAWNSNPTHWPDAVGLEVSAPSERVVIEGFRSDDLKAGRDTAKVMSSSETTWVL